MLRRGRDQGIVETLKPRAVAKLGERGALSFGQLCMYLKAQRYPLWVACQQLQKSGQVKIDIVYHADTVHFYYKISLPGGRA